MRRATTPLLLTLAALTLLLLPSCRAEHERPDPAPPTPAATIETEEQVEDEARSAPSGDAAREARYQAHVEALIKEAPPEFTIVQERPFVVIGDEPADVVQKRAAGTVRWATRMLKRDYFERDPEAIINIWLFKDKASYEGYTRAFFDESPGTPYGYYTPEHEALIMNISTGGGTLVHEMVHPFMAANFPDCPAWFNEGLASLYEQCGEKDGHIYGYTNWRLAGLKAEIEAGGLPSFKTLLSTTTREFYDDDRADNYAQARYLCYYLQHKGLLTTFYKAFVANSKEDPTGYDTLVKTLGVKDMAAFQTEWEAWVMGLEFPER